MPQPILRTERLVLHPLAEAHLEVEVELDSDPAVLRYLFGRARSRAEVEAAHRARLADAGPVDGLGFWMAYADGGDCVGLMMLPPLTPSDPEEPGRTAELGYRIFRRHWRQGYATEASTALLRHGFDTVGLERIIAIPLTVNEGSRAVAEKLGMTYVRTIHGGWNEPAEGVEHGQVEYAMTREEWSALR